MAHLLVYSNLMHEDELFSQGLSGHNLECVKVHDYKRVFNLKKSNDNVNACLNIEASYGDFFNALLIKDVDEAYFEAFDLKEKEFTRIQIQAISYKYITYSNVFVYKGKKQYLHENLSANEDEKSFCKKAALSYSEEFYEDFLQSTYEYKNSKIELIK